MSQHKKKPDPRQERKRSQEPRQTKGPGFGNGILPSREVQSRIAEAVQQAVGRWGGAEFLRPAASLAEEVARASALTVEVTSMVVNRCVGPRYLTFAGRFCCQRPELSFELAGEDLASSHSFVAARHRTPQGLRLEIIDLAPAHPHLQPFRWGFADQTGRGLTDELAGMSWTPTEASMTVIDPLWSEWLKDGDKSWQMGRLQPIYDDAMGWIHMAENMGAEDLLKGGKAGVCDFCSESPVVEHHGCKDFQVQLQLSDGARTSETFIGDWAACATCAALLGAGRLEEITRRAIERQPKNPDGSLPQPLVMRTQTLHRAFRENRTGRVERMREE